MNIVSETAAEVVADGVAVADIAAFLERFAPTETAEDWDNVGLLVGNPRSQVQRIMTCLTVTPDSVAEAIHRNAQMIVTHHPMPFQPFKRLTTETTAGRLLLELIGKQIAIYSPHTAFDSAKRGINQRLAEGLRLKNIVPLVETQIGHGNGRRGAIEESCTLAELAEHVKQFLDIDRLQIVGEPNRPISTVAIACGAAGSFLDAANATSCDAMLLGETNFHTCLEAEATGISLILPGHFASERFAVECLSNVLADEYADVEVWASAYECDPLRWV